MTCSKNDANIIYFAAQSVPSLSLRVCWFFVHFQTLPLQRGREEYITFLDDLERPFLGLRTLLQLRFFGADNEWPYRPAMCCSVISSRQSAATSQIVKRFWTWADSCKQRSIKYWSFAFLFLLIIETLVVLFSATTFFWLSWHGLRTVCYQLFVTPPTVTLSSVDLSLTTEDALLLTNFKDTHGKLFKNWREQQRTQNRRNLGGVYKAKNENWLSTHGEIK